MERLRSKRMRPSTTMRPDCGVTRPAIASTSVVLPEPERPKRATIGASAAKRASSRKAPRRAVRSTSSIGAASPDVASHQPFGDDERAEREQHREQRKPQRLRIPARHLDRAVDRERQRLGLPGDAGDERDRRTEFPERAGEAEERAGDDAGPGEREREREECVPRSRAESAGG